MTLVFMMLAGGFGAVTRFVVDGLIRTRVGRGFPWGTMAINVSGALLLGVLVGITFRNAHLSSISLVLGTGFCGGYTTFSTMSFETVRLLETRQFGRATFNMLATLGLALLGVWLGFAIGVHS